MRLLFVTTALCMAVAGEEKPPPAGTSGGGHKTMVIRGPEAVDDVALRDGEYATWHFGGGPLLEAGHMGGIYAEHRCRSLVRFDLSRLAGARVRSARLRLYKPCCLIQSRPVQVGLWAVSRCNRKWRESAIFCQPDSPLCSWGGPRGGLRWAGEPGCSKPGVDLGASPLDTQTADDARGHWIEFDLATSLVQAWIDEPRTNGGLCIGLAEPERSWGDHAFFHSSEHPAGCGPELILEVAWSGKPPFEDGQTAATRPPGSAPSDRFESWLRSDQRLARFARECRMGPGAARLLHRFDTTVRGDLIVELYQAPMAQTLARMEAACERGEEAAVRTLLEEVWRILLVWEYIRETDWYTAGPTADVLSPRELGLLYGQSIFGRMEEAAAEDGATIWRTFEGEALEQDIRKTLSFLRDKLELDKGAVTRIAPEIRRLERLEHENLSAFRRDLQTVRKLVTSGADGPEMLRAVRDMHLHHERFLYYQSIYSAPRWHLLLPEARPIPFARWVVQVRRDHYSSERIRAQQEQVRRYRNAPARSAVEEAGPTAPTTRCW